MFFFFFSSRRRHTRSYGDWSSDVCSSDLDADLGDQDMGGRVADAPDGGQAGEDGTKGAQRVLQARLELTHGGVECIDLAQVRSEERRVGKECRYRGAVRHEKGNGRTSRSW